MPNQYLPMVNGGPPGRQFQGPTDLMPYGGGDQGNGYMPSWMQPMSGGGGGANQYTPMVNGGPPGGQGGGGMWNPQINGGTTGGQNWGYGNAPGGTTGYYEQQTPMGSFAAANSTQAYNPYIGQQSQGIQGVGPIGQNAGQNPYIGGTSGQASAGTNPFAGFNNPYTTQAIDNASQDAIRNYNTFTAPQRDAQMVRSGSFGNSGVQQMQLEDQSNLQRNLGSIATNARMQDLAAQQQMGEGAANRQTGVSTFNVGANANDLTRNLLGTFQGQGLGLDAAKFNATNALGTQQFNAGLGAADLNRDATLAQGMGQFNAGQTNNTNMFNTGQANNFLTNQRGLNQNADQFNQTMDRNVYNDNMGWMRQGQNDTMNFLNQMMNWQGQGANAANQQQQIPLNNWLQMLQGAGAAGGQGGSSTNPYQGNPLLGFLAGMGLFGG